MVLSTPNQIRRSKKLSAFMLSLLKLQNMMVLLISIPALADPNCHDAFDKSISFPLWDSGKGKGIKLGTTYSSASTNIKTNAAITTVQSEALTTIFLSSNHLAENAKQNHYLYSSLMVFVDYFDGTMGGGANDKHQQNLDGSISVYGTDGTTALGLDATSSNMVLTTDTSSFFIFRDPTKFAQNAVISPPTDLLAMTHDFEVDCVNAPTFYEFSIPTVTGAPDCTITEVGVYDDAALTTVSTTLSVVMNLDKYVVTVSQAALYHTEQAHNFYIGVKLSDTNIVKLVEVGGQSMFTLNVVQNIVIAPPPDLSAMTHEFAADCATAPTFYEFSIPTVTSPATCTITQVGVYDDAALTTVSTTLSVVMNVDKYVVTISQADLYWPQQAHNFYIGVKLSDTNIIKPVEVGGQSMFTLNVAWKMVVVPPPDLLAISHDFEVDCASAPTFAQFSMPTLSDAGSCTITGISIYNDAALSQVPTDLSLVTVADKYVVTLTNTGLYWTQQAHNFYIGIALSNSGIIRPVEINGQTQFTLNVLWNVIVPAPSDLLANKFDFAVDCIGAPAFDQFSNPTVTGGASCTNTGINIYNDAALTVAATSLIMVAVGDKWEVKISDSTLYWTQASYNFYIGVSISTTGIKQAVEIGGQKQFTLNVLWNVIVPAPSDLSALSYDFEVDCANPPAFAHFSNPTVTGGTGCTNTGIEIYNDAALTVAPTNLIMVAVGDKWEVKISDSSLYWTQASYNFYIGVSISSTGIKQAVEINGQKQFTLNVLWNVVIVPPLDLTLNSYDYAMDCVSQPAYPEFSAPTVTGGASCTNTKVLAYQDALCTTKSPLLDVVMNGDKHVVQINDPSQVLIEQSIEFYIGVSISSTGIVKPVEVNGQTKFTLNVLKTFALNLPVELTNSSHTYKIDCDVPVFYNISQTFTTTMPDCRVTAVVIAQPQYDALTMNMELIKDNANGFYIFRAKQSQWGDFAQIKSEQFQIKVTIMNKFTQNVLLNNSDIFELHTALRNYEIVNPSQLTVNSFETIIDGFTSPTFYSFSPFTTNSSCIIKKLELFQDKQKTIHSKLMLKIARGINMKTVGLIDNNDKMIEQNVTFYLLVTVQGDHEHWINIEGNELFELRFVPHCMFFISFRGWFAELEYKGGSKGNVRLQNSGLDYFQTNSSILCPLTYFNKFEFLNKNGSEKFWRMDRQTGEINVRISTQEYLFSLTACGRHSQEPQNCVTTKQKFQLFVNMTHIDEDEEPEPEKPIILPQIDKKSDFVFVPPTNEKPVEKEKPLFIPIIEDPNVQLLILKVQEIDNFGKVTLSFVSNDNNKIPLESKIIVEQEFNKKSVHMILIPATIRKDASDTFKDEILDILSWNIESVEASPSDQNINKILVILQVVYANPYEISTEKEPDLFSLRLNSSRLLEIMDVLKSTSTPYINTFVNLTLPQPPQTVPSAALDTITENQENQAILMQIVMIFAVLIYFLVKFDDSSFYMVQMIRALQIISHFPLFQVILQGIVINQFSIMLPLLQFDLMESFVDWENQNVLEFNTQAIEEFRGTFWQQSQEIGYNSYNSIMILNTVALAILIYLIQVVVYILLRIYLVFACNSDSTLTKLVIRKEKDYRKQLFFKELHVIYTEGFVELLISTILTVNARQVHPLGETLSSLTAFFSLTVLCLQIPFSFFMILYHDKEILESDKHFQVSYGALYYANRLDTMAQRLYTPLLFLRRAIFIFLALSPWVQAAPSSSTLQIVMLIVLSVMTMMYNSNVNPFKSRFDLRLQQFNEFMIGICTYCLFSVHPEYNIVGENRIMYSWMLIGFVQFLIVVNMYIILKKSTKSIYLLLKKHRVYDKLKQLLIKVRTKIFEILAGSSRQNKKSLGEIQKKQQIIAQCQQTIDDEMKAQIEKQNRREEKRKAKQERKKARDEKRKKRLAKLETVPDGPIQREDSDFLNVSFQNNNFQIQESVRKQPVQLNPFEQQQNMLNLLSVKNERVNRTNQQAERATNIFQNKEGRSLKLSKEQISRMLKLRVQLKNNEQPEETNDPLKDLQFLI